MPSVWQVAAGDAGRDYSWLFREYDLMCLGPGRYGAYTPAGYRGAVDSGAFSALSVGAVAAMASKVQPGDTVLLRRGLRVVSIGVIPDPDPEGYVHDPALDDVYGWDLQHTRRVVWQDHLDQGLGAVQTTAPLFGGRKQVVNFTRVEDRDVLDPIQHLLGNWAARPLKPRPAPLPQPLSLEEFGEALFSKGLANNSVDQVLTALRRQRRLLTWYGQFGKASSRPTEHEVVAHMVLPILLALGWSEQLLGVEWKRVDLAGFVTTPTTAAHCVLVCEAKEPEHGLSGVLGQAKDYVTNLGLTGCRKILLTQGGRFYLHRRREDGSWEDEPSGYFNVECIRTNHIAPPKTNAVDTLVALTPAGVQRP